MDDKKIRNFFKQQLRAILEQGASDREGFRSYFAEHAPKDEEILGLLAVSSMISGEFQVGDSFPTPLEALASLTTRSRRILCEEFRKELKHCLGELATA
ncbi:MAG: hypothetical protein ACE145_12755 [Terriglobia bacterium]